MLLNTLKLLMNLSLLKKTDLTRFFIYTVNLDTQVD